MLQVEEAQNRLSQVRQFYVRFSITQQDAPAGTNWIVINPPDVAGDNAAAYGQTAVSWNLQ